MTVEAVLSIMLSIAYLLASAYLFYLFFIRGVRDAKKLMFWALVIFILSVISGSALALEEYGYREYVNTTTNETWRVPLYRENPYAYMFLMPMVFSLVLMLFFAFYWLFVLARKTTFYFIGRR